MIQRLINNSKRLARSIVLPVVAFAFLPVGFSQSAEELAEGYMQKYLSYTIDPEITGRILQADGLTMISAFQPFLTDSAPRTRLGAYQVIARIGTVATASEVRSLAVKTLVSGLDDTDGGIIGSSATALQGFMPSDFDAEQRYLLAMKVKAVPLVPHLDKLILLSGFIGIDELIYNFKLMLASEGTYGKKEKWNMKLAMARMGDRDALGEVVRRISGLKANDNVVSDIYPSLAYVRQKETFDLLLEAIMSDDKNCFSANPDNEAPIICAFRVLTFTAQYIEGFPLEIDKSGEPVIGNYDAALVLVRKWITENRDNYTLIKELY